MTRKKESKQDWVDDGRTIVSMDVDGMPNQRTRGSNTCKPIKPSAQPEEQLSARETRRLMLAGMQWALVVSVGFVLVLVLFVLFCVKVWLG